MKTKTIFTPEELSKHNFGLFIIRNTVENIESIKENPSYAATVSFKLGYTNHKFINNDLRYGKINFLTDGWFCPLAKDAEGLCEYLNNNLHGDEYRLMTKEEVIYLISNRQQGFLE